MRSAVTSIIPNYDVETTLLEKSKIVSVRVVNHVLVKHGVGVAQNESCFFFKILGWVVIICLIAGHREEHRVDSSTWIMFWVSYPSVLTFKIFSQKVSKLNRVPEKRSESATTAVYTSLISCFSTSQWSY
jgi:hypothetical protein